MTGEGQRQTYLEETYKTVLSPRTVLVETTDCDNDEWNVRLNKNCCVLRKWLIFVNAKAFISSSHRTAREVVKEIQGINPCTRELNMNVDMHLINRFKVGCQSVSHANVNFWVGLFEAGLR